ncbi:hypothetical protein UFOVP724_138 [uncultured Caudovirales phage]|uniref:Uncharacterized protein n=1 Tax=uncultured Caudovirales phage TaxID=2100421 RepID=A0A6J5NKB1_9CAUD|nr:hypothetical protein UFOVP724_138 [uncultured Caudovirales phage]
MKTKTFNTDEKTLLIEDIEKFINLLIDYKENKTESNCLKLIDFMKPTFELWASQIKSKEMYQVFLIYSLCRMLNSDDRPIGKAKTKIKNYNKYCKQNSIKIYDDLVMLFLEYLKKDKLELHKFYNETIANRIIYSIAMEMKYAMFVRIRSINALMKRDLLYYEKTKIDKTLAENPESVYIYNRYIEAELSHWDKYLLNLITQGYTVRERCDFLYMKTKSLTIEENNLWKSLKQMLLNN